MISCTSSANVSKWTENIDTVRENKILTTNIELTYVTGDFLINFLYVGPRRGLLLRLPFPTGS